MVNLMWYPEAGTDIAKFVSTCPEFGKSLPRTEEPVNTLPYAQPWILDSCHILFLVDADSGRVEVSISGNRPTDKFNNFPPH